MNQGERQKAEKLYNDDLILELYEFIKPFLESEDPYAFYLYSKFSLEEWKETDEEYDKRYVESLTKAAEGNVEEAMYRLSMLYFNGDIVGRDFEKAKYYLDLSLKLGYGPAKLTSGLYFFYGANGYERNLNKATRLISDAASEGVEGAEDALKKLAKNKS